MTQKKKTSNQTLIQSEEHCSIREQFQLTYEYTTRLFYYIYENGVTRQDFVFHVFLWHFFWFNVFLFDFISMRCAAAVYRARAVNICNLFVIFCCCWSALWKLYEMQNEYGLSVLFAIFLLHCCRCRHRCCCLLLSFNNSVIRDLYEGIGTHKRA